VLANLLSNAIKYSPGGGAIDVRVDQENDWAMLSVTDEGIGIPATDLPYVFDRFRRGENAAGKIPGTGIGLTAVRDIVERHGGNITAENRDTAGAIFTVRLPLKPPRTDGSPPAPPSA
jgi:signal transduction histidine kinase